MGNSHSTEVSDDSSLYNSQFQFLLVIPSIVACVFAVLLWSEKNSVPKAYADSMVDTYYYGYLNKIIPDNGHNEGGLKNRIRNYRDYHELPDEEFPFNKLFVIITSSGHVPGRLDDDRLNRNKRIELRQEMPPKMLDRAGVKQRVYKTSLYKIKFRGEQKHFTVAMEGAPPLLVLSDACKENSRLKKYKTELIYLFYTKLKEKLKENKEFEGLVELIYFDDESGKTLADELISRWLEIA